MTELEKWIAMREMVKEKYNELRKAIYCLSNQKYEMGYDIDDPKYYNIKSNDEENIRKIYRKIRSNFVPKDMKDVDGWLDKLSAVDLLHVFCYLNQVLRCFYHHVPVHFTITSQNKDMVVDYSTHRTGDFTVSNETLFKKFNKNLSLSDMEYSNINSFFCKEGENSTIKFTGMPEQKSKEVPLIPIFNLHYRRTVLTYLMQDAVTRYQKSNNLKIMPVDIDKIKNQFTLYSDKYLSKIEPIDEAVEDFYDAESYENGVTQGEYVGLDSNGHPITKKDGVYYDCFGKELKGSFFIDTSELTL